MRNRIYNRSSTVPASAVPDIKNILWGISVLASSHGTLEDTHGKLRNILYAATTHNIRVELKKDKISKFSEVRPYFGTLLLTVNLRKTF